MNLLQSSQNVSTVAPSYYNDYLNKIATKGAGALCNAQYVGAQPLQEQAFTCALNNAGNMAGNFTTGAGMVGCAANKDISGATTGYLNKATSASPLCAAKPYICSAANMNLGKVAQCYMSPYLHGAVQNMSDIAQRNIQMNLAPQATAGAVGSGQFGSQRGAQALGQVMANAEQCLNAQMAALTNQGYATAICGAKAKEAALGQAGQTAEQAQTAQNTAQLQAAQEAANATTQCAAAKNTAGLAMGTLGTEGLNAKIACQNALATLGAECQTIKQNAQCYPISELGKYAGLYHGLSIPTSTATTMCMSPLSAVASGAAGAAGILCAIKKGASIFGNNCNNSFNNSGNYDSNGVYTGPNALPDTSGNYPSADTNGNYGTVDNSGGNYPSYAKGGSIHAKAHGGTIGCASTSHLGGLPSRRK
jgi:hypothetical protein